MRKDRLIAGLLCIALAVWMFLSGTEDGLIAPAITITILGVIMIAISRKK
ncbi:MAG: hypothetical protein ABH934_00410 [Chloroflexota bacterium]